MTVEFVTIVKDEVKRCSRWYRLCWATAGGREWRADAIFSHKDRVEKYLCTNVSKTTYGRFYDAVSSHNACGHERYRMSYR